MLPSPGQVFPAPGTNSATENLGEPWSVNSTVLALLRKQTGLVPSHVLPPFSLAFLSFHYVTDTPLLVHGFPFQLFGGLITTVQVRNQGTGSTRQAAEAVLGGLALPRSIRKSILRLLLPTSILPSQKMGWKNSTCRHW